MPALADASEGSRPSVLVAENRPDARLIFFRIAPGQQVEVHTSESSVFITVLAGRGFLVGADGDSAVHAGMVAAFAPHEPHGMRAGGEALVLAALVAPRPGG